MDNKKRLMWVKMSKRERSLSTPPVSFFFGLTDDDSCSSNECTDLSDTDHQKTEKQGNFINIIAHLIGTREREGSLETGRKL